MFIYEPSSISGRDFMAILTAEAARRDLAFREVGRGNGIPIFVAVKRTERPEAEEMAGRAELDLVQYKWAMPVFISNNFEITNRLMAIGHDAVSLLTHVMEVGIGREQGVFKIATYHLERDGTFEIGKGGDLLNAHIWPTDQPLLMDIIYGNKVAFTGVSFVLVSAENTASDPGIADIVLGVPKGSVPSNQPIGQISRARLAEILLSGTQETRLRLANEIEQKEHKETGVSIALKSENEELRALVATALTAKA